MDSRDPRQNLEASSQAGSWVTRARCPAPAPRLKTTMARDRPESAPENSAAQSNSDKAARRFTESTPGLHDRFKGHTFRAQLRSVNYGGLAVRCKGLALAQRRGACLSGRAAQHVKPEET